MGGQQIKEKKDSVKQSVKLDSIGFPRVENKGVLFAKSLATSVEHVLRGWLASNQEKLKIHKCHYTSTVTTSYT